MKNNKKNNIPKTGKVRLGHLEGLDTTQNFELIIMALAKINPTPEELKEFIVTEFSGDFESIYQKAVELQEDKLSSKIKQAYDLTMEREMDIFKFHVINSSQDEYLDDCPLTTMCAIERLLSAKETEPETVEDFALIDITHAIDYTITEFLKSHQSSPDTIKAFLEDKNMESLTLLRHASIIMHSLSEEKSQGQL